MAVAIHIEPDPALYPILARHLGRIDPPPTAERRPGEGAALRSMLAGDRTNHPYSKATAAATIRKAAA